MKVIDSAEGKIKEPVCLMIGNYDGLHLGHQSIIAKARALGKEHGLKTAVLSFDPHPLKLLAPDKAPPLLHTPHQKELLLSHHGVDYYLIQNFDRAFSQLTPDAFLSKLHERVDFRFILVGFNFRFGFKRTGTIETLRALGPKFNFQPIVMEPCRVDGEVASSSRIRNLAARGDLVGAARLLDRPFFLEGEVVPGKRVGRTIHAPTANFEAPNELLPKFGVYASWCRVDGQWHRSITNIGRAPTIERGLPLVESQLFDFNDDLYGKSLLVCLGEFIRPEKRFPDLESLKTQIQNDVAARKSLPDIQPPPFHIF